jgi:hypothetical protein
MGIVESQSQWGKHASGDALRHSKVLAKIIASGWTDGQDQDAPGTWQQKGQMSRQSPTVVMCVISDRGRVARV